MNIVTRLAPLTGLAAIAAIVASLASDELPDSTADDATLAAYVASHGVTSWFAMATGIAVGGVLLLVYAGVVAARVADAGGGAATQRVLQAAGTAWGVLTLVGGALIGLVPIKIMFYTPTAPTAAIYPYLNALSYTVLVSVCAYAAALFALTLSVAALQTGLLPRWLAIAGFPLALLMLANIVLPMAVIGLYTIMASIVLTVRRPTTPLPAPVPELSAAGHRM